MSALLWQAAFIGNELFLCLLFKSQLKMHTRLKILGSDIGKALLHFKSWAFEDKIKSY